MGRVIPYMMENEKCSKPPRFPRFLTACKLGWGSVALVARSTVPFGTYTANSKRRLGNGKAVRAPASRVHGRGRCSANQLSTV